MSRKWDNFSKPVPHADIGLEMEAFSDEGYELVAVHPITDGAGNPWGYDVFFRRPAAKEAE